MLCIDIFSKYCAIVPIEGKTESELALGFIECMNKMGGPPKVLKTYGEGALKNYGLCQNYFTEHHITYIPSRGHPVFAERMIRTFREMLDKRITPGEDRTGLIYPILLTYNNKLVHAATEFTPNDARKETNELMTYINMKMKAKHNRRYPELHFRDHVQIYQKIKLFVKGHVSRWTNETYTSTSISRSNGVVFYNTTARAKRLLKK